MTTHGCGNSPRLIRLLKLLSSVTRKLEGLVFSSSFHTFIDIRQQQLAALFQLRPWHLPCKQPLHKPSHAIGGERFKGYRGDVMKKKLMGKVFRLLGEELFPLLIQRFQSRPNFARTKRHKKVSLEREDIPKVLQFLKTRFGQTASKRH